MMGYGQYGQYGMNPYMNQVSDVFSIFEKDPYLKLYSILLFSQSKP